MKTIKADTDDVEGRLHRAQIRNVRTTSFRMLEKDLEDVKDFISEFNARRDFNITLSDFIRASMGSVVRSFREQWEEEDRNKES